MDKCPHCKGSLNDVSLVELYLLNCPHCGKVVLTKREYERLNLVECMKRNNELEKRLYGRKK